MISRLLQTGLALMSGLVLLLAIPILMHVQSPYLAAANGAVRYVALAPMGTNSSNDCLNQLSPCATIQYAVDQATAGDEIRITSGLYTGIITRSSFSAVVTQVVFISKSLTVRGGYTTTNWNNPVFETNLTIIDAQGLGRVVNVAPPSPSTPVSVTIEGLSLVNGNAVGQNAYGYEGGGGINGYLITATLRNNYIAHNHGGEVGGGILFIGYGPFELVNNTVVSNTLETANNHALGGGIALAIYPDSNGGVNLTGNIVRGNIAKTTDSAWKGKGGGIYILAGNKVGLTDNIIAENRVESVGGDTIVGGGGGIFLDGSHVTLTNTVIVKNRITGQGIGAGIHVFGGDVTLLHTTANENDGGDDSGISIVSGIVTATNTILANHTYGITVSTNSTVTLTNILWFANVLQNVAGNGSINISNEIAGNPAFMADGFHLGLTSAAIDKGVNIGVITDIDGEPRAVIGPDIGADEASFWSIYVPVIIDTP